MTKKAAKKTAVKTTAPEPEVEIEVTPEETAPAAEAPIALTPLAVKMICEIIAVCTKRGAFVAEELTAVGNLYDQLRQQLPAEEAPAEEAPAEEQQELPLDDKK